MTLMLRCLFVLCFFAASLSVHAERNTLKFGVLTYEPDIVSMVHFQALVDEISKKLPNYDIQLQVTDVTGLENDVTRYQYDLMLIDPVHYLKFRSMGSVDTALLSIRSGFNGLSTSLLGGVIFTKRESDVSLNQLGNAKIAAYSPFYLENYIAQIYELKNYGYPYPELADLHLYDNPDDTVLAVLNNEADVGFVRSGVLERLHKAKKIDLKDIRVLNEQNLAGYPYLVSTRLYPEWVVVANTHLKSQLIREITSSLLSVQITDQGLLNSGIYGFTPALNYLPVEQVLQELNYPPYDLVRNDWKEVLKQNAVYVLLVNVLALGLVFLSWHTYRKNRQLSSLVRQEQQAQLILVEANQQLDALLSSSPTVIYSLDPERFQLKFISSNCVSLYQKTAAQIQTDKKWWQSSVHEDDISRALGTFRQWRLNGCHGTLVYSYRLSSGADWVWIEDRVQALRNQAGEIILLVGAHTDITTRHISEEQLELWASVFANAREGIAITNPAGEILDVNTAFSRITGYDRHEIVGQNPRILNSGRQSREFYQEMWRQIINIGFWEGEIWNKKKDGSIYAQNLTVVAVKDAEAEVSHYISLFSDITRQKRNEEKLEHIAYFDSLTGLPNRTNLTHSLDDKIHHAKVREAHFALAFLDLDGFKEVNDTFGHDTGDLLLIEVANRMRATVTRGSVVSRFGGDEFVLLLPADRQHEDVEQTLLRVVETLSEPFRISGVTLQISASIGVTYYPQVRDVEADQLIRQADQAMYQAKISGRNRLKAFDLSQEDILVEQHRFYDELQQAYDRQEFCLYYQPKVNMRTREVIGYEALIRWQHPERGLLLPAAFLPAITNQPLELDIGRWVLKTALEQIAKWQAQGVRQSISVNIAGFQLQQPAFIDELKQLTCVFDKAVVESLELEILETSAIEDLAIVSGVIDVCKELGIRMSLDDFGTGYSTLSHLKELSVDMLKIDHGFVRDMLELDSNLAIIKGVIGFAKAFSLDVIAEGVETPEHAKRLLELGCDLGQGYCISRPMPADVVLAWQQNWLAQNDGCHSC